jgi:hypothetical protein
MAARSGDVPGPDAGAADDEDGGVEVEAGSDEFDPPQAAAKPAAAASTAITVRCMTHHLEM